jgi:hypothetical protein
MKLAFEAPRRAALSEVLALLFPLAVNALLWITSINEITPLAGFAATVLFCLPYFSFRYWQRQSNNRVPLLAIVGGVYWLYYAPSLFWGDRLVKSHWLMGEVDTHAVTLAMTMVLVGVLMLWLGVQLGLGRHAAPQSLPDLKDEPFTWTYVRIVLLLGAVATVNERWTFLLGDGGRQFMTALQVSVPLTAFVLVFRRLIGGKGSQSDKIVLGLYVLIRIASSLASGWLGDVPLLFAAMGIVYVSERRRIPVAPLLAIVAVVLFLQPGKPAVRAQYWHGDTEATQTERVASWLGESYTAWSSAIDQSADSNWKDLAYMSLSRVSLLTQTAEVAQLTPEIVPHQGAWLYSYMVYTWVPRAIWTDKPIVNEANQFYQVAYGLTSADALDTVSIAVGSLTEAYITFGWAGVVALMFLMGMLFDWVQRAFLGPKSGALFGAIGVVAVISLMGIEGQLAQYLSGVVQRMLVTILVFFPIIESRIRLLPFGLKTGARATTILRSATDAAATQ